MKSASIIAPWPNLPPELWLEIAQYVKVSLLDAARFRSVCKLWRSSLPSPAAALAPTSIPSSWHDCTTSCLLKKRTIYRVNTSRRYPPFVVLEQINHDIYRGDGTIINNKANKYRTYHLFHSYRMLNVIPRELNVVNDERVSLSPVSMYYYTASSNKNYTAPNVKIAVVNDVMVALLYGAVTGELAVLSGDPSMQWKTIESTRKFDDIVEYKGKFFMVDRHGRGFIMDHNTLQPYQIVAPIHNQKSIHETELKGYRLVLRRKRLVVNIATGDLYLLIPWSAVCVNKKSSPTIKVYMLSNAKGGWEWNEVRSIGSRALIVGSDFSFCSDVAAMFPYVNRYSTDYIFFDGDASFPMYGDTPSGFFFGTPYNTHDIMFVYDIETETFFTSCQTLPISRLYITTG